jgi:NADH:ubiquinone oxidoreductase subunit H
MGVAETALDLSPNYEIKPPPTMSLPFSLIIFLSYLMALLAIAFYTLLERKLLGYFQLRKGPNKIALAGLPQPLADALKLFLKEHSTPTVANLAPFALAPLLGLSLALTL